MSDQNEDGSLPPSEIVQTLATRDEYADAIRGAYRQTVEGIFRMGRLLIEARRELPHGEFGSMVEEDLPFSKRTSRKLRAIARDERLRNRTRASDLPPAWSTLYRLTRLDDREWEAVEPHISPDMNRSEIPELVRKGAQLRLATPAERNAEERVEDALRDLPSSSRNYVKKRLLRPGIPPTTAVRVAEAVADLPEEEQKKLVTYETPPPDLPDAEDLQMVLPGFAREAREELLERDALDDPRVEGARSAANLQALLRWAEAFADRTDAETVLDGAWAVRDPERVAERARRVAEWMTTLATDLEFEQAFREMEPRRPED